jgi:hypothetical protein
MTEAYLIAQAAKQYRELAERTSDARSVAALLELADECETKVRSIFSVGMTPVPDFDELLLTDDWRDERAA